LESEFQDIDLSQEISHTYQNIARKGRSCSSKSST